MVTPQKSDDLIKRMYENQQSHTDKAMRTFLANLFLPVGYREKGGEEGQLRGGCCGASQHAMIWNVIYLNSSGGRERKYSTAEIMRFGQKISRGSML
jgi:hypothetical protein